MNKSKFFINSICTFSLVIAFTIPYVSASGNEVHSAKLNKNSVPPIVLPEVSAAFVKAPKKHGDMANIRLMAYRTKHKIYNVNLVIEKQDQKTPFYTYSTKNMSNGVFLETLRLDRFPRGKYKMIATAIDTAGGKSTQTVAFTIR